MTDYQKGYRAGRREYLAAAKREEQRIAIAKREEQRIAIFRETLQTVIKQPAEYWSMDGKKVTTVSGFVEVAKKIADQAISVIFPQ